MRGHRYTVVCAAPCFSAPGNCVNEPTEHDKDHAWLSEFRAAWKGIYWTLRIIALLLGIAVSMMTLYLTTRGGA
jgi:hypothetical protein